MVLLLIGWKSGARFLSQSCDEQSAKPITFRHSNENRSIFTKEEFGLDASQLKLMEERSRDESSKMRGSLVTKTGHEVASFYLTTEIWPATETTNFFREKSRTNSLPSEGKGMLLDCFNLRDFFKNIASFIGKYHLKNWFSGCKLCRSFKKAI